MSSRHVADHRRLIFYFLIDQIFHHLLLRLLIFLRKLRYMLLFRHEGIKTILSLMHLMFLWRLFATSSNGLHVSWFTIVSRSTRILSNIDSLLLCLLFLIYDEFTVFWNRWGILLKIGLNRLSQSLHLTLAANLEKFLALDEVIFLVFVHVDHLLYSCRPILVINFFYFHFLLIILLNFIELRLFIIILNFLVDFIPLLIQNELLSVLLILLPFDEILSLSLG